MIKSESLAKLAPALLKAQKKMGAALKDAKNPFFKSKYADLNAVIDAVVPVLNEEGIAVLQTPQLMDGKQVIQTVLLHESGEYYMSNTEVVAAKANDPQAAGSAISYSRRYGLQATTTLKAEDDDGESAMGRKPMVSKVVVDTKVDGPDKGDNRTAAPTTGPRKVSFARTKPTEAPTKTVDAGDDI